MLAAAAVLVGASPASAASPLDPPRGIADTVAFASLPDCSAVSDLGLGTRAAAQLGFVGAPFLALRYSGDYGAGTAQLVPLLPCTQGGRMELLQAESLVTSAGSPGTGHALGVFSYSVHCYNGGTNFQDFAGPSDYYDFQDRVTPGTISTDGNHAVPGMSASNCQTVASVTETFEAGFPSGGGAITSMTWKASLWRSGDGGWVPADSPGGLVPPGTELPIVCDINTSGADIGGIIGNVVSSLVAWVPCELTPVGWDRAGHIPQTWSAGGPGQLVGAFRAALPSTIGCGTVGGIQLFSQLVTVDTCVADIAPDWAKVVVGWLIVLGLGALAVRRILWTVGSSS